MHGILQCLPPESTCLTIDFTLLQCDVISVTLDGQVAHSLSLSLDFVALEILLPFSMSPILFDAHALQAGSSTIMQVLACISHLQKWENVVTVSQVCQDEW